MQSSRIEALSGPYLAVPPVEAAQHACHRLLLAHFGQVHDRAAAYRPSRRLNNNVCILRILCCVWALSLLPLLLVWFGIPVHNHAVAVWSASSSLPVSYRGIAFIITIQSKINAIRHGPQLALYENCRAIDEQDTLVTARTPAEQTAESSCTRTAVA